MASERQEIDTFAVVDDRGILIGILTVDALVDDILADPIPEGFLPDVTGLSELISSAGRFVKHRSVGEIMDEVYAVTDDDKVGAAIQKMHVKKLRGIPVVDAGGKVTGYLDLFDTLVAWMRSEPNDEGERV
jgi:CBS domain-containing protein